MKVLLVSDDPHKESFIQIVGLAKQIEDVGVKNIDAFCLYENTLNLARAREYNYLRPMGYPTTFIVNRVHEYVLIFRKQNSGDAKTHAVTGSVKERA
jgi:hypothetical protein